MQLLDFDRSIVIIYLFSSSVAVVPLVDLNVAAFLLRPRHVFLIYRFKLTDRLTG